MALLLLCGELAPAGENLTKDHRLSPNDVAEARGRSLVFSGQPKSARRASSLSLSSTAEQRGSTLCWANAPQVALAQA